MKVDAHPSASAENEALEWATEFFRERTDDLFKVIGVSKEVTEEHFLFAHQMSLEGYIGYIDKVLREEQNTLAVCRAAATLIERGERLSKPLGDFVAAFLRDPKKMMTARRGRKRYALADRDWTIGEAIDHIVGTWKILATRKASSTKRPSATSIVKEALEKGAGLHLSEAEVVTVWNNWRRDPASGKIIGLEE